jgi:hypothetical protein
MRVSNRPALTDRRSAFKPAAMATNLSAETLHLFITRDSASAWDAMAREAAERDLPGGGNFMFARQAVTLLELAVRVCRSDATGTMLRRLSEELARIEPRYFTELPADVPGPKGDEFNLSSIGPNPRRELLRLLFDPHFWPGNLGTVSPEAPVRLPAAAAAQIASSD